MPIELNPIYCRAAVGGLGEDTQNDLPSHGERSGRHITNTDHHLSSFRRASDPTHGGRPVENESSIAQPANGPEPDVTNWTLKRDKQSYDARVKLFNEYIDNNFGLWRINTNGTNALDKFIERLAQHFDLINGYMVGVLENHSVGVVSAYSFLYAYDGSMHQPLSYAIPINQFCDHNGVSEKISLQRCFAEFLGYRGNTGRSGDQLTRRHVQGGDSISHLFNGLSLSNTSLQDSINPIPQQSQPNTPHLSEQSLYQKQFQW